MKVGNTSEVSNINVSIPLGSDLGPPLFILYINDFTNISNAFYSISYADITCFIIK